MARLALTAEEAAICDAVGVRTFVAARAELQRGGLAEVGWSPETGRVHGSVAGAAVTAAVVADADGVPVAVEGSCGCPQSTSCAHPVALVLAVTAIAGRVPRPRPAPRVPAWESALAALADTAADGVAADGAAATPVHAGVGLQFELVEPDPRRGAPAGYRVALRPVVPGRSGAWVRSGVSWSTLGYARYGHPRGPERHWQLLHEILALAQVGQARHYYHTAQALYLDSFPSRRIWDLLAEAHEAGLPLVQAGKWAGPVVPAPAAVRPSLRAERDGADLVLVPGLSAGGAVIAGECCTLVGDPAHGVAWWAVRGEPAPPPRDRVLWLAALHRPLGPDLVGMLAGQPVRIPSVDVERFLARYYPRLARRVEIVPADDSVRLPDLGAATLTLAVTRGEGHRAALAWGWELVAGDPPVREPLWTAPLADLDEQRQARLRAATEVVGGALPHLVAETPTGPRLAAEATVAGDDLIRLLTEVLPRLAALDGVAVRDEAGPAYREAAEVPAISFVGADRSDAATDWFDLSVRVAVGAEEVPFDELFVALAEDRGYLILPSGTYLSLDRPELRRLRDLIAESRALQDAPAGVLRVGRCQLSLWQDIAEVGEVAGEAADWQRAVRALTGSGAAPDQPVPAGLRATLRPYQVEGFRWLAVRYAHGLGGVLADDMGLGKTLQVLALICHAREVGAAAAPFLVVAPASVVHNWAAEAARFAPELVVTAVTQTEARRGVALPDAVKGADVVLTSYTLFRLEHDDYLALDWAGLVLDEAQFVKNPHAQGYRCAKRLRAPVKVAITGTPMENNLLELWALLSITAPGLFPRVDRFTEHYRTPIERGRDADRLAQLRRRIRPLMLRRRKADVALDLPDKQEQVVELELNPRHRRVYQRYLQRERQKVLGLLGDLEQNRFEIFRSLTLLRQASLDVALVDPAQRAVPSTKLDVLVDQVTSLVAEGHRSLVFSQFTRFLDAARQRLSEAGVACCYLDGSTRDRAAVLAEFKSGAAPVFLISLKAGGFGLNLTEADYCILLDPWWNPATEAQAVDRVHRIGQTRRVMVYRLVARDTIEEKVMALKARKAELFRGVLDGGDFSSARLTAADIRELLE
ncbi:MAG TPA: SNF2-related protein [Pilimelia sp.]|nr:SNF2-related protein [Pilimelia sp.]